MIDNSCNVIVHHRLVVACELTGCLDGVRPECISCIIPPPVGQCTVKAIEVGDCWRDVSISRQLQDLFVAIGCAKVCDFVKSLYGSKLALIIRLVATKQHAIARCDHSLLEIGLCRCN